MIFSTFLRICENITCLALSSDQINLERYNQIVSQALESSSKKEIKLIETMVGFPQDELFNTIFVAKSNQIEE